MRLQMKSLLFVFHTLAHKFTRCEMVLKKNEKYRPEKSFWKSFISDELLFRIMNIVGQTGISPPDLILKWVLQEESLIGMMQQRKEPVEKPSRVSQQKTTAAQGKSAGKVPSTSDNSNYRKGRQ